MTQKPMAKATVRKMPPGTIHVVRTRSGMPKATMDVSGRWRVDVWWTDHVGQQHSENPRFLREWRRAYDDAFFSVEELLDQLLEDD